MDIAQGRHWLTHLGVLASRPIAFIIFISYAIAWVIFGALDWHSIATLATWAMTLFIQRAEHRDTQAIHAKLDELLKVNADARNEMMQVDHQDAEEVEQERDRMTERAARRS